MPGHTVGANGHAVAGEDAHGADIGLCEGVLDGGGEEASSTADEAMVDGAVQGILGVVEGLGHRGLDGVRIGHREPRLDGMGWREGAELL